MEITNPLSDGYCEKCKYNDNGKCLKHTIYNKPIPVFAIEKCNDYSEKDN